MAFSFRAGTNWCHDFPKLARESGFYFNMHTARIRIDWNRISSIDIDRVIRERDFQTVDENVNNVIDYHLESEYDVKILDPNFVKLFRLAQLAVEYLLYCKQYLDQSVVILKEELKYKLEENVKLKEDAIQLQDTLNETKEKFKEKTKVVELKPDPHGEIHKCPHCPKTFVSASFASAHLMRRHSNLSEMLLSSTGHEEYRAETEKLHNEIKTLKERLNQTERVIRSESKSEVSKREKSLDEGESQMYDDQYRRYQEEISNLKTMLFTEIRNIKRKENSSVQQDNETIHESIKELVSQQENEIQRLRNQLQDHLTSNANEVQTKLIKQEEYWKTKIEQLESQYRNDIENIFTQLKSSQESANYIKSEYEEKVALLEKQSLDQSKLLATQSEQLNNLARGMMDSKNHKNAETQKFDKQQKIDNSTEDRLDTDSSQKIKISTLKKVVKNDKRSPSIMKSNQSYQRLLSTEKTEDHNQNYERPLNSKKTEDHNQSYERLLNAKKPEAHSKPKSREEIAKESNLSKLSFTKNKKSEKLASNKNITKIGKKYTSLDESEKSESSTMTETDSDSGEDTEEDTSESSANHTESTDDEVPLEIDTKPTILSKQDSHLQRRPSSISLEAVRQELQETFDNKLRDLGIDPEWDGVPELTFRQKMESIKHHQNIASKKFPKYEQIRRKILDEISRKISVNQKSPKNRDLEKKSFLNKAMKNVKSKALKALNEFKVQKGDDSSTPLMSSKNSTPRELRSKRRFSLELLPKKPTQMDIQEIKRQTRLESAEKPKKEEQVTKPKPSQQVEEISKKPIAETISDHLKRTKLQRSYQSIEEFMRDIEESPKLDMHSTKITSTPSRNVKNVLQDTYSFANDSDEQVKKPEAMWALNSPKNNKSVLKSTTSTMGSLVKKKVLFDLEKETSSERVSTITKSIGELIVENNDEKKESNDSDWNISSISEEKEKVTLNEKNASSENIQLKTSQSEKIAEISRKIQEKLEASRRKPVGSIEAMFAAKTFSTDNDEVDEMHVKRNSRNLISSVLESPTSHIEPRTRTAFSQMPRPAPRKQLFETKDSDLEIDKELLTIK